jgi:hypothetical protein
MLKLAWFLDNIEEEMKIFDIVGLNCYHQGKMDRALYFHKRYADDIPEKKDSALR